MQPIILQGLDPFTLDGKTNTNVLYFADGLKHNLLNVGQLVDKCYEFHFTEKISTIKDKNGKMIETSTRYKGNIF